MPVPSNPVRAPIEVGDLFVLGYYENSPQVIHLARCEDLVFEDVTIWSGPVMGIIETNGEGGNTYRRLTIAPGPLPALATESRLRSVIADGIHLSGVAQGPLVEDSFIADNADDGIAIHGRLQLVLEQNSSMSFYAAADEDDAFGIGDHLDIISPDGSVTVDGATVTNVTTMSSHPDLNQVRADFIPTGQYGLYTKLALIDVNIPVSVLPGDRISNRDRCGDGFIIRRNHISYNRGRGLMLRASSGVIEKNIIEGSSRCAIAFTPDMFWNEAGYSLNIAIRYNTFADIGFEAGLFNYSTVGAVSICGSGQSANVEYGYFGNGIYALPGGHDGISIEYNTFDGCRTVNLLLASASNVIVRGNAFSNTHPAAISETNAYGADPYAVIWVTQTQGINFVSGNTLSSYGSYTQHFLEMTSSVTGESGEYATLENWQP